MKRITGRLATKNQKWYAVLNLYDTDGVRKQRWISLDLEDKRGTKTEANHRLAEVLAQYNVGDLYLQENMTHAERERNRIANMLVENYLPEWLEQHKPNISSSTYLNYKRMINGRMTAFFKPMKLKVKEVTGDEINAYYTTIRSDGLKGTTAQRHHAMDAREITVKIVCNMGGKTIGKTLKFNDGIVTPVVLYQEDYGK